MPTEIKMVLKNNLSYVFKIALLTTVLFCFSCSNEEEVVVEKYPDESPKLVRYYKVNGDNKILVKEIAYYPAHKKMMEGGFEANQRDGLWQAWYENGNLWSESEYDQGIRQGRSVTYYENGKCRFKGTYDKGVKSSTWFFYDSIGNQTQSFTY